MNKLFSILSLILVSSCVSQNKETVEEKVTDSITYNQNSSLKEVVTAKNDTSEITALIRKVFTWHYKVFLKDFPYLYDDEDTNIFIGIDWMKYEENIKVFKKLDCFSDSFFSTHKKIAIALDSSIKKTDIKWRNIMDGIPIWETGADNWCQCQDYPNNYWEYLLINNLNIIEDTEAHFNWTWDTTVTEYPISRKMSAEKVNGNWKVKSIEGFKYFGTVEDYDKLMME